MTYFRAVSPRRSASGNENEKILTSFEILVATSKSRNTGTGARDVVVVNDVGTTRSITVAGDVATTSSPVVDDLVIRLSV